MTSLIKKLCFIIFFITIASPAFAFIETAVDFDIYNPTQHEQTIQAEDGSNVFEITLVNYPAIPVNDSNWVKFDVSPVLHKGFVLDPFNNDGQYSWGLFLGVVRYAWWSEGYLYATRIKFKIKSPGFRDRVCDIRLEVESVGDLFNRDVKITGMESANIMNDGICQVSIGAGYEDSVAMVSIKIIPDTKNY